MAEPFENQPPQVETQVEQVQTAALKLYDPTAAFTFPFEYMDGNYEETATVTLHPLLDQYTEAWIEASKFVQRFDNKAEPIGEPEVLESDTMLDEIIAKVCPELTKLPPLTARQLMSETLFDVEAVRSKLKRTDADVPPAGQVRIDITAWHGADEITTFLYFRQPLADDEKTYLKSLRNPIYERDGKMRVKKSVSSTDALKLRDLLFGSANNEPLFVSAKGYVEGATPPLMHLYKAVQVLFKPDLQLGKSSARLKLPS
jgi:hypothetical protein